MASDTVDAMTKRDSLFILLYRFFSKTHTSRLKRLNGFQQLAQSSADERRKSCHYRELVTQGACDT